MKFAHDDKEWPSLLEIVADALPFKPPVSLVEKDYWVTHSLWALHAQGFALWFKGGTSLSKGFGLIERFSEDLDLRVDAGRVYGLVGPKLPWIDSNKSRRKKGVAERDAWFDTLAGRMKIPSCVVTRNPEGSDQFMRSVALEVAYPGRHVGSLPGGMKPFVLLEVGQARVVPFVERALSSWVHDHLIATKQAGSFTDNRPIAVRCVHPWVTCLEKLEAIVRRFDAGKAAADFVRHYEDAARIIDRRDALPDVDVREIARLLRDEDGTVMPPADHAAFNPADTFRWSELEQAWAAVAPMYWGERQTLRDATARLRSFLAELHSTHGG